MWNMMKSSCSCEKEMACKAWDLTTTAHVSAVSSFARDFRVFLSQLPYHLLCCFVVYIAFWGYFCASGFIVFVLCHAPHMSLGLLMLIVFIVCFKNQLKHLYLDSRLTLAVFPSWFSNFEGRTTPAFVEYGNQYKHQNKKTRIQTQQTIDKVLIRRKSLSYKYLFGSPSFPMSGWIMSAKPCAMKIRLY